MEQLYWQRGGKTGTMTELVMTTDKLSQLLRMGHAFSEFHLFKDREGQEEESGQSIGLEMQVLRNGKGVATGISLHARDLSREWGREQFLQDRHVELEQAYARLKETQMQLLQSEKMASIGQLAAGVAHEINNPIGYVHSNLGTLQNYSRGLLLLLEAYDRLSAALPESARHLVEPIDEIKSRFDYPFLQQDLPQLVEESREGIERVKKIVLDLRDFSHSGESEQEEWVLVDVHRGLESTLNIVWNEIKYKAEVRRDFGELSTIECLPSQLNQVFLNLLVNAGQAISHQGEIGISTRQIGDEVCVSISDTGAGMTPDKLQRIFDPFFTTKPVGQGTGLGLSLSYGIVQKHGGRIEVESTPGKGSSFHVYLPIRRSKI
jgi:two-component system, NtrC family, sensor kinase